MDVKPGYCLRCEKRLPRRTVPCSRCPVVVYCSTSCRDRDKGRHASVECQTFQAKKCSVCGKLGKTLECSGCNDAWYCDTDCQRRAWPGHKTKCKEMLNSVKELSLKLFRGTYGNFPLYIGNTIAEDFLQLGNNELSTERVYKEQLTRAFHVLSAGSGNLRNTVLTAASLPDEYRGKLHIALNDHDPLIMARNVLFLFMLVRFEDADYIASSLTTIWYSLHLSKRDFDLVKTSLVELIQMNAQKLHDATKGLVTLLDEDLGYLKVVWEKWRSLECQRDKKTSINLRQQRKVLLIDRSLADVKGILHFKRVDGRDRTKLEEWFEHGLFFPYEAKEKDMPFDNPTMTAPKASKTIAGTHLRLFLKQAKDVSTEDATFVYCIGPPRIPFEEWDSLRVRERTPGSHSSPMVMYHRYVTNLLQKVKGLILQGRLLIHVSLADCLDFPNHHRTLNLPNYDRIFTSNLTDYVGIPRLLHSFKPLLNASNSCSAIVTETMNWREKVPGAKPGDQSETEQKKIVENCFDSTKGMLLILDDIVTDYCNNTPHFVQYLRADIMAGGLGIPSLKEVPSFESVKKYHGLQMRDFRKGQNKLVPFQYLMYKRTLNENNVCDRAVEWCLPKV